MFWTIIMALLVLWLVGSALGAAGGYINLLLVAALCVFFVGLYRGRATTL